MFSNNNRYPIAPTVSPSLWLSQLEGPSADREPLDRDLDVDVVIVGAGFTGLWSAYYLLCSDPSLRVAVLEADTVGFGASGRNGGWVSALWPVEIADVSERQGSDVARRLQGALNATVDEVERVVSAENIDCGFVKGGSLMLAESPLHVEILERTRCAQTELGFGADEHEWLSPTGLKQRLAAPTAVGALFSRACARVQPACLAAGLARVVEERGGQIFEHSPVTSVVPGAVTAAGRSVRSEVVLLATEAYSPSIEVARRHVAPVWSRMIATEPLSAAIWEELGWENRETLGGARLAIFHAQRTTDDRIAFGGLGGSYRFGSKTSELAPDSRVTTRLHNCLRTLLPAIGDAQITHTWGGPVGIPRSREPFVYFDRASRIAAAGGYMGDGVPLANLAGRSLADLVLGRESELLELPWVAEPPRDWEREPLRFIGINAGRALFSSIDRAEQRTGQPARVRRAALKRF